MDRVHRALVTTFFAPPLGDGPCPRVVELGEGAAHHARVKRLDAGDPVQLTDGLGAVASGAIERLGKRELIVAVGSVTMVPALPEVHLFVPVADRDRMLMIAEKAAELGVTSWRPVYFRRSRSVVPRGEGAGFDGKVRARMTAALEQSGGAWLPDLHPAAELRIAAGADVACKVVLEAAAPSILSVRVEAPAAVMVGPEGGIEGDELDLLHACGWRSARIEGNTLRFETAAIAAVAIVRSMLAQTT